MNGQGMWETKKKKSHKKRRKQKHIDILNDPPRLKSTFYKDLNRGPKNIWKLQTIKWWDPVTQVPTFPQVLVWAETRYRNRGVLL